MSDPYEQDKTNKRNTKMLEHRAREIILSVRDFCEAEKFNGEPIIPFHKVRCRVAAMTGISEKTVSRITAERKIAQSMSPINMKRNATEVKHKKGLRSLHDVKRKNKGPKAKQSQKITADILHQLKTDAIIVEYKKKYSNEEENVGEVKYTKEDEEYAVDEEYTREEYLDEEYLEDEESQR